MKYLENLKDLEGKTIKSVRWGSSEFYIIFTDDTWTAVDSEFDQYDDYASPVIKKKSSIDHNTEYSAGIITSAEYKAAGARYLKNAERTRLRQEKQTYERLKEKFEKEGK